MTMSMTNKELVERYPFLKLGDDYDYTKLDWMDDGWRIAFGEMMCEEIREVLVKHDALDSFYIEDIKEKWGFLNVFYSVDYDSADDVDSIIDKYAELSKHICARCGKPDVPITAYGWVYPMCEECFVFSAYRQNPFNANYVRELKSKWNLFCKKGSKMPECAEYKDTVLKIRSKWANDN